MNAFDLSDSSSDSYETICRTLSIIEENSLKRKKIAEIENENGNNMNNKINLNDVFANVLPTSSIHKDVSPLVNINIAKDNKNHIGEELIVECHKEESNLHFSQNDNTKSISNDILPINKSKSELEHPCEINQSLSHVCLHNKTETCNNNMTQKMVDKNQDNSGIQQNSNESKSQQDKNDTIDIRDQYDFYLNLFHSLDQLGWCDIIPYYRGKARNHIPCYWPVRVLNQDEVSKSSVCTKEWEKIIQGTHIPIEVLGWYGVSDQTILIIKIQEFEDWSTPKSVKEKWKKGGLKINDYIERNRKTKFSSNQNWIYFDIAVKIGNYIEKYLALPEYIHNEYSQTFKNKRRLNYSELKETKQIKTKKRQFKETVREKLEAGDTITFFYSPLSVTYTTKIMSIDPQAYTVIKLQNNIIITDDTVIQRIKDKHDKPITVDYSTGIGCTKPFTHFRKVKSSINNSNSNVKEFLDVFKDHIDAIRNEYNNTQVSNETTDKEPEMKPEKKKQSDKSSTNKTNINKSNAKNKGNSKKK